ncbi:lipocalin family protein [Aurantibacter crassamenti]|uniref:lipocalin family protein n=1 Tax=Aurantibacter crassamenti TaxID=1837375 RepID=UPI00193960E8|nr:lipocalin family protein [Aurantibacter crassamenti]MBM1105948.1 lipocalin family protein [Aurantibacter crassamenti]
MQQKFIVLMAISVLFFSCSDDKEDASEETAQSNIEGTWDVTELKIDSQNSSDDAKFGSAILDHLTNKNCTVVSFTFNADMTLVANNSTNYLEVNVNSTGSGLDIPCPTEVDTETSVYTYDGTTLSYVDAENQKISVSPIIEGNLMTITAADLGYTNLDAEGELVFTKR